MQIGPFTLRAIEAGLMKLDGGAMFGSVPKALWQREHPADDENRILLSCRILLATDGERSVLVDTGMGDKWTAKEREIYGMAADYPPLDLALERAGVDPESITDVILTHLHFDHAGGVTKRNAEGLVVPTFPRAKHWLQRRNLENAKNPNPRERVSYQPQNFEALLGIDLELLDGEAEVFPHCRVHLSDGHTVGMQLPEFFDDERGVIYCADLIPTATHVHPAFTMGYDINAGLLIEEKAKILDLCRDGKHMLFFEHDPRGACARPVFEGKRVRVEEYAKI